MSSLATQMRQEPSTETPMVNHVLSFRTETVHGWITKETVSPSLLRMTAMYMKRMEQASTGMVKVQMYTICLYSKAWISQKDIGLNKSSGITAYGLRSRIFCAILCQRRILIQEDMV